MPLDVKVPSIGESITSGVLGVWRKKPGEFVRAGDVLFEIETDKVTSEVFADSPGILHQLVAEGAEVKVGQVVATITEGNAPDPAPAPAAAPSPATKEDKEKEPVLSPAVRVLVEENKLDPATVKATGKGGRLLKEDVLAHLSSRPATASTVPNATPSGPRQTRRRMSALRKKVADRLVGAQHTAAILTTFNEVDMSAVMALRSRVQDRFLAKHGIKLGFMSFFVKAVVHALRTVPQINARIEGDEIVENHFYDIGVAIGTEKGLMVPVVRNAEQLDHAGIEKEIAAYAQKARSGKITLQDLEGGVFTISNGGIYGSLLSTPILNPPQSGILGMHTIQERPVAVAGRVEIRPMMYLALSYDHRLVDGKEAVTFLISVKEYIENPGLAAFDL